MREIKFRAWDKKEDNMRCWETILDMDVEIGESYPVDFPMKELNNEWEWMQFTDLLDKQGKDIYFDDYLKIAEQTFIVKWNGYKISLLNISYGDIIDLRDDIASRSEIKSNLYENSNSFTPKYTEIPKN